MEDNKLIMAFKDESASFAHGFACGQIWEKVQSGEKIEDYLCLNTNIDQIIEIAKTFGCDAIFKTVNDEWLEVTIKPKEF